MRAVRRESHRRRALGRSRFVVVVVVRRVVVGRFIDLVLRRRVTGGGFPVAERTHRSNHEHDGAEGEHDREDS